MSDLLDVVRLLNGEHDISDIIERYVEAKDNLEASRRAGFEYFGIGSDEACPASLLFHRQSEINHGWMVPLTTEEIAALVHDLDYKRYPNASHIALDPQPPALDITLTDAIAARRSRNEFADAALTFEEVSRLLLTGTGVTSHKKVPPRRGAPSAGALYPIETYLIALDVESVPSGVYHYAVLDHELEHVSTWSSRDQLRPALPPGLYDETPAAVVVLSANLPRIQAKYVERGYRFAMFEAGHTVQNLALVTAALGLAGTPLGGFCDPPMNALLGIDGEREVALYAYLVGRPRP